MCGCVDLQVRLQSGSWHRQMLRPALLSLSILLGHLISSFSSIFTVQRGLQGHYCVHVLYLLYSRGCCCHGRVSLGYCAQLVDKSKLMFFCFAFASAECELVKKCVKNKHVYSSNWTFSFSVCCCWQGICLLCTEPESIALSSKTWIQKGFIFPTSSIT